MLEAGLARADLTVFEPSMALLGWGVPDQRPQRVGAPLSARALVLRERGRRIVVVTLDLCFVSAALRARVLRALDEEGPHVAPADLVLLATHTHSGPGGYSHAFFYDLAAPGLSERVLDGLARSVRRAIRDADERCEPARLGVGTARVRRGVAFNRSLDACLRNPEVATPEDAVDRTLTAVRIDDRRGRPRGALLVFPLHATSIHGDRRLLHPDHKGLAAWRLEGERGDGFVALFAQGAAGDATPNHRFDPRRGVTVGAFDDDLASAAHVAEAEVEAARRALDAAAPIDGPIASTLARLDLEDRPVAPPFAPPGARTTPGRLGVAMALGTREGPGPLAPLARLVERAHAAGNDPKRVLLEVGPGRRRRLFGRLDPARVPFPHPAFARARRLGDAGGLVEQPWIPTTLPLQLVRLGPLGLLALPNEPTRVAGRRLAAAVREAAPELARVLVLGYANAYSGYLTTPEEYTLQRYEGAYTLFGPHSLGAYAAEASRLARDLSRLDGRDEGPPLPLCTLAQERARSVAQRPPVSSGHGSASPISSPW